MIILKISSGKLWFNNTNQKSATTLHLDSVDNDSSSINSFMTTLDSVTSNVKGFVRISKKNDNTSFIMFQRDDVTNKTGWWSVDVTQTNYSSEIPFSSGNEVVVSFLTNGSKGDKGDRGFTGFLFTGYRFNWIPTHLQEEVFEL